MDLVVFFSFSFYLSRRRFYRVCRRLNYIITFCLARGRPICHNNNIYIILLYSYIIPERNRYYYTVNFFDVVEINRTAHNIKLVIEKLYFITRIIDIISYVNFFVVSCLIQLALKKKKLKANLLRKKITIFFVFAVIVHCPSAHNRLGNDSRYIIKYCIHDGRDNSLLFLYDDVVHCTRVM
jgi:hypothetical protein